VKTAGALVVTLLLALAAPAHARIVVVDGSGAVVTTPVRDDATTLIGWTDDGAALIARREERTVRVDVATGAATPQPLLDDADSIGPGGRAVFVDYASQGMRVTLRAPDGRVVGSQVVSSFSLQGSVAWSADGARVAVLVSRTLLVLDTATGVVLTRVKVSDGGLDPQAFAPDASALLVGSRRRVLRVDVASGAQSELFRSRYTDDEVSVAWGAGRVAVRTGSSRIELLGSPPVQARLPVARVDAMLWNPDGSALAYAFRARVRRCEPARYGVGLLDAVGAPRPLLPPTGSDVGAVAWSPDGQRIAVELGKDYAAELERRGRRHPWPKRIARDYEMFSRRGDAAMRRIVLHVSRALRRGAGRAEAMRIVSTEYERVAKRFSEARDSAVGEALADEVSKWLRAAGFAEIDALEELEC
jgi:hypothetical protein